MKCEHAGSASGKRTIAETDPLAPLLAALRDLSAWLEAGSVRGAIIGGVAASLHGRPRATRDVDVLALLDETQWEPFLDQGQRCGFAPRLSDALDFARRSRVLLVRHEASLIDVDIAFGALQFEEESVARSVLVTLAGVSFRVVTPEDLVIMKAVAQRPRDLADIGGVLDADPDLDVARIRRWVGEFAQALDQPDIVADLERLLNRARRVPGQAPGS